jgi:hypothetical protein
MKRKLPEEDDERKKKENSFLLEFFPFCLVNIISDYRWPYQQCVQCKNFYPYSLACFLCLPKNVLYTYTTKGNIIFDSPLSLQAENDEDSVVFKYVSEFTSILVQGYRRQSMICAPRKGKHGPYKVLRYKQVGNLIMWDAQLLLPGCSSKFL